MGGRGASSVSSRMLGSRMEVERMVENDQSFNFERTIVISARDGERIADNMNDTPLELRATLNELEWQKVEECSDPVIFLHNHPNSTRLSFSDFRIACLPKAAACFAAGHNGDLYGVIPKVTLKEMEEVYNDIRNDVINYYQGLGDNNIVDVITMDRLLERNKQKGNRWFTIIER